MGFQIKKMKKNKFNSKGFFEDVEVKGVFSDSKNLNPFSTYSGGQYLKNIFIFLL